MNQITLIATLSFGLEAVVKRELRALGFETTHVANGKVEFAAAPGDIPRANLWLRSADRVLLKMGEFPALTFDDLFEQTKALPWESVDHGGWQVHRHRESGEIDPGQRQSLPGDC